jgi:hypothetical protein
MRVPSVRLIPVAALAAIALLGVGSAGAQVKEDVPQKFTAFAVDTSNLRSRAAASSVEIVIEKWSTDAQRDKLLDVLQKKGQDGLLDALEDMPVVGYIRSPGSLRYNLRFARQRAAEDGGRMIVLATDRQMSYWERTSGSRTTNYPFTVIQLQLDKNDEGVGKVSVATKIHIGVDNVIELENFANQPVRLNEVKPER